MTTEISVMYGSEKGKQMGQTGSGQTKETEGNC